MAQVTAQDGLSIDPLFRATLEEVRRRRWLMYYYGRDLEALTVIAGVFRWPNGYTDVVLLRGSDDAAAYRVRTDSTPDLFAPEVVTWYYVGDAVWVLRAVLTLDEPGPLPVPEYPAPFSGIPADERLPVKIRPTQQAEVFRHHGK